MSEVREELEFYRDTTSTTRNPRTAKLHSVAINRWLDWLDAEGIDPDDANGKTVRAWMVALSEEIKTVTNEDGKEVEDPNGARQISDQGIINYAKCLQSIYNIANEDPDTNLTNVFASVKFSKVFQRAADEETKRTATPDDEETKYISTTDARKMLNASREPVEKVVNGIFIHCGVRLDELRHIRYEYVCFEDKYDDDKLIEAKNSIKLITSKQREVSWRVVFFPESFASVLKSWIGDPDAGDYGDRGRFGNAELAKSSPYLLTGRKSAEQMREEDIREIYVNTADRIGIQAQKQDNPHREHTVTPKSARHHYGYSRAKKLPLHLLASLMGHSDPSITAKYYVETPLDELRDEEHKSRPVL